MSLIQIAIQYASYHHRNQKRKYTNLPYIMHTMSVAGLVSTVTKDVEMICASILHDVVEDCPPTILDIRRHFTDRIAKLVNEVTEVSRPEDGNREKRKGMDREHFASASAEGQTIKVADLIDNTSTIMYLDKDFAKVYLREKQLLLEVLTKADKRLVEIANNQVKEYYLNKNLETLNHRCQCSCCQNIHAHYENAHTESARKAQKDTSVVVIGDHWRKLLRIDTKE